jgi:MULE transposase domain
LDGCFLKSRYGDFLLAAVAVDANDCIFPISYVVVEGKNSESWCWFLQILAIDIGIVNSNAWTFMSDRQNVHIIMLTFYNFYFINTNFLTHCYA